MYNNAIRRPRDFKAIIGKAGGEHGRAIYVTARSSLEAGLILLTDERIGPQQTVLSLLDPVEEAGKVAT